MDNSIKILFEESLDFKEVGDNDKAVELLNRILMQAPDCGEAYEELGDNYLTLRDLDKAYKALQRAIKINKESSNAHYLLGFVYSVQELWGKSVRSLEKADDLSPNHPEILRCLGWAYFNKGEDHQGIAILERAHDLNPYDTNVICDLGVCWMNLMELDKAEELFGLAMKIDPTADQPRECMSMLQMLHTNHTKKLKTSIKVEKGSEKGGDSER